MRVLKHFAVTGVSLLALSTSAFAQDAPAEEGTGEDDGIVVIGTLIRGAEVVGADPINVDATTILEKGAGTTNELLSTIPQLVSTFGGRFEIDPRGFATGTNSINKPNLRSLPAVGAGAITLVTTDGMRLTPVGVNDAATDVDIIPSNVLAGIDAVTDGGSSLYGADAVGGVLNFRTRTEYEGLKLDLNYGFGDTIKAFKSWDGSILAGQSWSGGNAYISVSHYDRSQVINADVPWSSGRVYTAANPTIGAFSSTQCIAPVGSEIRYFSTGTGYTSNPAAPGAGRFPIGTACDQVSAETYTPETKRTNVFAAVKQEFSDSLSLRVTGYWAKRDMYFAHYPTGASTPDAPAPTQATNPNPLGVIVTRPGGTGFSFAANSAYVDRDNHLNFETWGVTPELTWNVDDDWQVRTALHYGRSTNFLRRVSVDQAKVLAYVAANQLNPLNVGAASAAVIDDVTNFENADDTKHTMFLARVIMDGPLFELPAGEVKLAYGLEYQWNKAAIRTTLGQRGSIDALPFVSNSRNAKSIFAELNVPLFEFLDLTASGRYDDYSDFGTTFNPNFGATFKPTDWLKIFGHWNTSYNAPTALDGIGLGSGRLACGQYIANGTPKTAQRPTDPNGKDLGQGTCALILSGGSPAGIDPQTADSWAVGFEVTPARGLSFGMTYYSIDFKNVIGTINPANLNTYSTNPDNYIYNVTDDPALSAARGNPFTYAQFLSQIGNGAAIRAQQPLASNIALVVDARRSNLNSAKVEGLDFHVNYTTDTSFGKIDFALNGNVPTKAIVVTAGSAPTNELGHINPKWTASTSVGWEHESGFKAKLTINARGRYENATADFLNNPINVDNFFLTDLFLGYSIKDTGGVLDGTSLRVNVDNLFDRQPTRVKLNNTNFPSYTNWTLGRVFKFGITKEF